MRWLDEVFTISGDIPKPTRADALSVNSQLFLFQGEFGRAQELAEEALRLWREVDDKGGIAVTLHDLGSIALCQGETDRARELALEGLAMRRELGRSVSIAHSLNGLAEIERYCGNYEGAEALLMEATSLCPVEDPMLIGMRGNLAHVALNQHKHEAAERLLNDSLPVWRDYGDRTALTEYLVGMAGIRIEQGRFVTGARLLGAVAAEVATSGAMLWPPARAEYDHYGAICGLELGDAANAEAIREGRHLDIDSAINLALEPAFVMESRY
jgi:tetratricopeptide (TPR) repeat protein